MPFKDRISKALKSRKHQSRDRVTNSQSNPPIQPGIDRHENGDSAGSNHGTAYPTSTPNGAFQPSSHQALQNGGLRVSGSQPIASAHTESHVAIDILRNRLVTSKKMGIPDRKRCFPSSLLNEKLPEKDINDALQEDDDVKAYACSNRKVFATLLKTFSDNIQVVRALKIFQTDPNGFSDKALPIAAMDDSCKVSTPDGSAIAADLECGHDANLCVLHHYPWNPDTRQKFYDAQWQFLMPRLTLLNKGVPERYDSEVILPVIKLENSKIKGSGYFSEVYSGEILAEYLEEVSTPEDVECIAVAIKQLKNRTDEEIVDEEWQREIEACSSFNKLKHDHITRGIAACKHSDRRYIFFEWADGDNLRKFWERNPNPTLNEKNIFEFLYQVYGLVDALYHMHNDSDVQDVFYRSYSFMRQEESTKQNGDPESSQFLSRASTGDSVAVEDTDSTSSPSPRPSQTGFGAQMKPVSGITFSEVSVGNAEATPPNPVILVNDQPDAGLKQPKPTKFSNWRHGDIKPENIFVFSNDDSWLGTLKLGDLGRAKKHDYPTRNVFRRETGETYGTREYEPPEAVVAPKMVRSRRYDIWPIGCIIFEAVCWLLYGLEKKVSVETKTTEDAVKKTKYWIEDPGCRFDPKAKVNPTTASIIDHILKNDPECNAKPTALQELLQLARDHLLVVHLPPSNEAESRDLLRPGLKIRYGTEELRQEIMNIVQKAKDDSNYLFSKADRTHVRSPLDDNTGPQPSGPSQEVPASGLLQAPGVGVGQKWDSYAHDERDVWEFVSDAKFAQNVLFGMGAIAEHMRHLESAPALCTRCSELNFQIPRLSFKDTLQELDRRAKEKACTLCPLLAQAAREAGVSGDATAHFLSSESTIKLQGGPKPYLSICQPSTADMERIRTGLPSLPPPASPSQYAIMRSWLESCNNHTKCARSSTANRQCPSRLIDVKRANQQRIYIVEKNNLVNDLGKEPLRYVAFSHPWGDATQHSHFTSTISNIQNHINEGIDVRDLPNTFQGAIEITRQLDVRYLWIDSLCILQGDGGDFEQESKTMHDIYGSAYFSIAASSATGTSSRLFGPRPASVARGKNAGQDENGNRVDGNREIACLLTKEKQPRPFYISKYMDDFQADVLNGYLSQRGWVFQERALSRRTIYLTNNQAYWECGEGIRCETLTMLRNPVVRFLGDPNFPEIAADLNKGGQIVYYESVYEKYSALNFTYEQDRSVAIHGLESRICTRLGDKGGYGVFRKNLGRGLLWRHATGRTLAKIDYSQDPSRGRFAPSWSWMAWAGAIEYMKPVGGSLTWSTQLALIFEDGKVTTKLDAVVRNHCVPQDRSEGDAGIYMDDGCPFGKDFKVVVVGKEKLGDDDAARKNYVLIVRAASTATNKGLYHRVGVGWILGKFIEGKEQKVWIE